MKTHTTLLIVASVLLISACSKPSLKEKLIGEWMLVTPMETTDIKYNPDYTFDMIVQGKARKSSGLAKGTWSVEGDKLTTVMTSKITSKELKMTVAILSIDDRSIDVKPEGDDRIVTLARK